MIYEFKEGKNIPLEVFNATPRGENFICKALRNIKITTEIVGDKKHITIYYSGNNTKPTVHLENLNINGIFLFEKYQDKKINK